MPTMKAWCRAKGSAGRSSRGRGGVRSWRGIACRTTRMRTSLVNHSLVRTTCAAAAIASVRPGPAISLAEGELRLRQQEVVDLFGGDDQLEALVRRVDAVLEQVEVVRRAVAPDASASCRPARSPSLRQDVGCRRSPRSRPAPRTAADRVRLRTPQAALDRAPLAARLGDTTSSRSRPVVRALAAAGEPLDVDEVDLRAVHRRPMVLQSEAALPLQHLPDGGRERRRRRGAGVAGDDRRTRSRGRGPAAVSDRRPSAAVSA